LPHRIGISFESHRSMTNKTFKTKTYVTINRLATNIEGSPLLNTEENKSGSVSVTRVWEGGSQRPQTAPSTPSRDASLEQRLRGFLRSGAFWYCPYYLQWLTVTISPAACRRTHTANTCSKVRTS